MMHEKVCVCVSLGKRMAGHMGNGDGGDKSGWWE